MAHPNPFENRLEHSKKARERQTNRRASEKYKQKNRAKAKLWYDSLTPEKKAKIIARNAKYNRKRLDAIPPLTWEESLESSKFDKCAECGRRTRIALKPTPLMIGNYEVPMYTLGQISVVTKRHKETILTWVRDEVFPKHQYRDTKGINRLWTYDQVAAWTQAMSKFDTSSAFIFRVAKADVEIKKWLAKLNERHISPDNYVRVPNSDRWVLSPQAWPVIPLRKIKRKKLTGRCQSCFALLPKKPEQREMLLGRRFVTRMFMVKDLLYHTPVTSTMIESWILKGAIPRPMYYQVFGNGQTRRLYTEDQAFGIARSINDLFKRKIRAHERIKELTRYVKWEFSKLNDLGLLESAYTIPKGEYLSRSPIEFDPPAKRKVNAKKTKSKK